MRRRQRTTAAYWVALALAGVAFTCLLATGEPRVWLLLANTARLTLSACAIAVPLGTVLAIVLARSDLPGRRWIGLAIVVMLFVPLYLQAAGWDAGFGRQGWFSFTRDRIAAPPLRGWTAAIWIHGLAGVPWVVLIVGAGLRWVESEFEEVALLEASVPQVLWRVTLRRSWPAIVVSAIWVAIAAAGEMTITDLYQVRTYAEEIYQTLLQPDFSETGVQWFSIVLLVAAVTMVAVVAVLRLTPPATNLAGRNRSCFPLGAAKYPVLLATLAVTGILVGVPLANLTVNAGVAVRAVDGGLVRQWEFAKFAEMVFPALVRYSDEFKWTLLISGCAATAVTAIALPLVWYARQNRLWAACSVLLAAVCLATPGPLIGLSLIWILNRDSDLMFWLYDRTIFAPVTAMVVRSLPLAILISWFALRSVASDVLEAAATEGAGAAQRFWKVALPQRFGAIAAIWLSALAVSMGDLSATKLVMPAGINTVALRIFGLLHAGVDDSVAGLSLTTFAVFFFVALLVIAVWRPLISVRDRSLSEYNEG